MKPKALSFFDIVADWADDKGREVIFLRDFDEEKGEDSRLYWWAIIKLSDARGPFRAEIRDIGKNPKKIGADGKPRMETDQEYVERVRARMDEGLRQAIKERRFYQPKALAA
jgi:hypothetical protein